MSCLLSHLRPRNAARTAGMGPQSLQNLQSEWTPGTWCYGACVLRRVANATSHVPMSTMLLHVQLHTHTFHCMVWYAAQALQPTARQTRFLLSSSTHTHTYLTCAPCRLLLLQSQPPKWSRHVHCCHCTLQTPPTVQKGVLVHPHLVLYRKNCRACARGT